MSCRVSRGDDQVGRGRETFIGDRIRYMLSKSSMNMYANAGKPWIYLGFSRSQPHVTDKYARFASLSGESLVAISLQDPD